MSVEIISQKTSPLCFLPNGKLVCYRLGFIIIYYVGFEEKRFRIFKDKKESFLAKSRIAFRLFRLGIRAGVAVNNDLIIFSFGTRVFELNLATEELSKGYQLDPHVRPMVFSKVKGIDGFEDGIYFGGYVGDLARVPINIYYRVAVDKWQVVYTFPQLSVDHVHNIIQDPYRNCLWVMTGDFGEAAALWKATNKFASVEKVLSGNQQYRGCIGFALPEGLLFATDSPLEDNYIYLLKPDMDLVNIMAINGSCIYGCQWGRDYVFESTVEPDGIYKNLFDFAFRWKKGQGIKSKFAHIYVGNLQEGFKDVYQEKKDRLPFIFRFAAFAFPNGVNKSDELYFQPIATCRNDLSLLKLSMIK